MRCKLLEKVQRIASRARCKAAWERKEHSTRHHAERVASCSKKLRSSKQLIPSKNAGNRWPAGGLAGWPGGRVWPCGRVAVWPCGRVAVWPCGRVAVWPCDRVTVWPWSGGRGRGWVAVAGWPWPRDRVAGWPWSWPGGRGRVAVAVAVAVAGPWPGWPATKKSYCGFCRAMRWGPHFVAGG